MSRDKVLVLMATYNGENYISAQIHSILSQTGVDIELIISDDLSTDKTINIINSIKDSRIILLNNKIKFRSAALNFFNLIKNIDENTDFNYVAFSDQDDIWFSEKLSMGIKELEITNASAYSSSYYIFNSKNNDVRYGLKPDKQSERDFVFQSPGPGNTFILKKNIIIHFKKYIDYYIFNSILYHDWIIYAFARVHNYKWVIDKKSFILYRQHQTNVLGANSGLSSQIKRILPINWLWYKNHARFIYNTFNLKNDIILYEIFNHKISFYRLFKCKDSLRSKKLDAYILFIMIKLKNI